jgi:transcriptional regulator with XRE-family HTH domain
MSKIKLVFTKKIAELLTSTRKQAKLTQTDVAKQIGLSVKSGRKYISYLETGRIRNPSFNTIILYLDACHTSYLNFFSKFSELRFKESHQEIMLQAKLPKDAKTRIKIDRDTALHSNKIKYQTKTPVLDYDKLKAKIDRALDQYMSDHRIDKQLIPIYQDFTSYVLKRVLNPKPNPPLDFKPWLKSGIRPNLLDYINRMIYKIVRIEKSKLNKRKLPTTDKQKKMVIGFMKYREMMSR